jgi:hypothetical protein
MNSCWNNEKCYEYLGTLRNTRCAYYTFFSVKSSSKRNPPAIRLQLNSAQKKCTFADIQRQQKTLHLIHSELKSTKKRVVLHEISSGIRRHPYIIICSLYKVSKKIAEVVRARCQTTFDMHNRKRSLFFTSSIPLDRAACISWYSSLSERNSPRKCSDSQSSIVSSSKHRFSLALDLFAAFVSLFFNQLSSVVIHVDFRPPREYLVGTCFSNQLQIIPKTE